MYPQRAYECVQACLHVCVCLAVACACQCHLVMRIVNVLCVWGAKHVLGEFEYILSEYAHICVCECV